MLRRISSSFTSAAFEINCVSLSSKGLSIDIYWLAAARIFCFHRTFWVSIIFWKQTLVSKLFIFVWAIRDNSTKLSCLNLTHSSLRVSKSNTRLDRLHASPGQTDSHWALTANICGFWSELATQTGSIWKLIKNIINMKSFFSFQYVWCQWTWCDDDGRGD